MSSSPTSPTAYPASPSLPLPAWHFPFGPSSRYHHTERPRLNHSRTKSAYIPKAPVLSTEKRAHRRAHNRSIGSVISPPLSECGRSLLSRFPSFPPRATMAKQNNMPVTPAKSPRRSTSSLQDSPFSDYFSDDARSCVHNAIPSNETKALLVRMNKLQSQLMRDQSATAQRRAMNIFETKLSEMEAEINEMHLQRRQPDELEDSGVFMQNGGGKHSVNTPSHSRGPSIRSVNSSAIFSDDTPTADSYKAERDWLLLRMQELLDNLNTAHSELRQRQVEVKELNDLHSVIFEEKDTQIEQLRSENEGLRQDLGFEYSELLFLKLQMKSMDCDVSDLREERDDVPPSSAAERSRKEKKNRILSEMDHWRTDSDWQDVEARFKRRRSKYGIPTSPIRKDSASSKNNGPDVGDGEVEWQLETQRGEQGRVTSLTIKRMGSPYGIPPIGSSSSSEQQHQSVTFGGTTDPLPTQLIENPTPSKLRPLEGAAYTENGTQTYNSLTLPSSHQQPSRHFSPLEENQLFPDSDAEENDEDDDDNECAITTSSEADHDSEDEEDPYEDVEEDEEAIVEEPTFINVTPPQKSAWQELWSSLQSLSGLGEDDEDDD